MNCNAPSENNCDKIEQKERRGKKAYLSHTVVVGDKRKIKENVMYTTKAANKYKNKKQKNAYHLKNENMQDPIKPL